MPLPIKTPTSWRPASGQGTVVLVGLVPIVNNVGVKIVTNTTVLPLFTNPTSTKPKNPTSWTPKG